MKIRKSEPQDLERILEIYAYARRFMAEHGNPDQWGPTCWPPESLVRSDIAAGEQLCLPERRGKHHRHVLLHLRGGHRAHVPGDRRRGLAGRQPLRRRAPDRCRRDRKGNRRLLPGMGFRTERPSPDRYSRGQYRDAEPAAEAGVCPLRNDPCGGG